VHGITSGSEGEILIKTCPSCFIYVNGLWEQFCLHNGWAQELPRWLNGVPQNLSTYLTQSSVE
jgi:hypothetical protein